jgi:hypothetical protein
MFPVFKNISNFFINRLEGISNVFSKNKNRGDINYNTFLLETIKLSSDVAKAVKKGNYQKVEHLTVPVTLGLRTDLLTTTAQLKIAMELSLNDLFKHLDDLDTMVAKVMTDVNYRTSTKPIINTSKKDVNKTLENILSTIIDPYGKEDIKKINTLIPNISSIQTVHNNLLELAKGGSIKDMQKINDTTVIIGERIKELEDYLTVNNDVKISSVVINELASQLEETAKLITLSMSVIFILNQTLVTFKNILKRIL